MATAFVAALATILGMIGVGDLPSWRDHDGFVRPARGAFQRLKTTDGCSYEFEPPDLVATPVGLASVALDADVARLDRVSVHAPPGSAIRPTPGLGTSPAISCLLLSHAEGPPPALAQPHRPALGRAPPLA